jgi:hypothetical protein
VAKSQPRVPPLHADGQNGGGERPPGPQLAPIITELAGCRFDVVPGRLPDGSRVKTILFTHLTGALQYRVILTDESAKKLVGMLTGGIHVP